MFELVVVRTEDLIILYCPKTNDTNITTMKISSSLIVEKCVLVADLLLMPLLAERLQLDEE